MRTGRRRLFLATIAAGWLAWSGCGSEKPAPRPAPEKGWTSLFDGKTLDGWEAFGENGKQKSLSPHWVVRGGVLRGSGELSHLFSPRGDYKNFRYRVELMINEGGNSGMYFRAAKGAGFPKGYEAQVNSTHKDPVRTGSLYNMVLIKRTIAPPDAWFTQEVEAVGNHLTVKVNGVALYEFVDASNTYSQGHFAFQQHDPGSVVEIRKVEVMELPD